MGCTCDGAYMMRVVPSVQFIAQLLGRSYLTQPLWNLVIPEIRVRRWGTPQ